MVIRVFVLTTNERKLFEHEQKFELLIKSNLPPREGIFFDGQVFGAYGWCYTGGWKLLRRFSAPPYARNFQLRRTGSFRDILL